MGADARRIAFEKEKKAVLCVKVKVSNLGTVPEQNRRAMMSEMDNAAVHCLGLPGETRSCSCVDEDQGYVGIYVHLPEEFRPPQMKYTELKTRMAKVKASGEFLRAFQSTIHRLPSLSIRGISEHEILDGADLGILHL